MNRELTIMRTHCDGEVWGLAFNENTVYTTGDDNLLMEWDVEEKMCTMSTPLMSDGEVNTYSQTKVAIQRKVKYTASTMGKTKHEKCARAVDISP